MLRNAALAWLAMALPVSLGGCGRGPGRAAAPPHAQLPRADGVRALAWTAELTGLGARASGTPGGQRAAEWIAAQCRALGYAPEIEAWRERTPAGWRSFRNVVAVKSGRGSRRVLLGSHYDTKALVAAPDFIGANDSGSSTGLLLEIMRAVRASPQFRELTLEFVFFDGEECLESYGPHDGLHGSRHHAGRILRAGRVHEYAAMILLDMIGDADLGVTVPMDSDPALVKLMFQASAKLGTRERFGYFTRGAIVDDQVPFQALGIPVINLIDFSYGPGNRYWHTAEDTLDKLSAESLAIVGDVVLHMLHELRRPAAAGRSD